MQKKRFRVFVDKRVQGALARRVTLYWVICLWGTFCVLAGFPIIVTWLAGIQYAPSAGELLHTAWLRFWPTLVASAFMLPIIVWDVMRVSHRFAGPMIRLRHAMRDLADGKEVSQVTFRGGDHWTEFADHFNRLNERIRHIEQPRDEVSEEAVEDFAAAVADEAGV